MVDDVESGGDEFADPVPMVLFIDVLRRNTATSGFMNDSVAPQFG